MAEIASGSGLTIISDGDRLLFIDTRTGGLHTAAFVLGLLSLVPLGAGIALFASGPASRLAGMIVICIGAFFSVGFVFTVKVILRRRAVPVGERTPMVVVDLAAGVLRDGAGRQLAPLDAVRFHRQFQMTSSSPALAVSFQGTNLVLVRGNPFAGGLGSLESALQRYGLMK